MTGKQKCTRGLRFQLGLTKLLKLTNVKAGQRSHLTLFTRLTAALLMTVRHAAMKGVKDFFLIHDSFATVPGDTWLIYDAIRYSFVNMYDEWCLYSSILEEVKQQIPLSSVDKLPEVPAKGDLDINVV